MDQLLLVPVGERNTKCWLRVRNEARKWRTPRQGAAGCAEERAQLHAAVRTLEYSGVRVVRTIFISHFWRHLFQHVDDECRRLSCCCTCTRLQVLGRRQHLCWEGHSRTMLPQGCGGAWCEHFNETTPILLVNLQKDHDIYVWYTLRLCTSKCTWGRDYLAVIFLHAGNHRRIGSFSAHRVFILECVTRIIVP